jgi:imidazolonepropionase-like amidohydrolase
LPTTELKLQLRDFTRYGFTSVFDLSSAWENTRTLRDRIESREAGGPRIRSTGEALAPPGSLPPLTVLRVLGVMETSLNEIESPSQAREATKKLLATGVDGIKLFISSPYSAALEPKSVEAAVEEAHRDGKPVFAHPNNGADVLAALRAGVDVIAHTTPRSGPWDDAILTEAAQRNVAITPTLKLWHDMLRHDRISAQRDVVAAAVDQLRAWRQAGGRVLFGTDYGAVGRDPTEEYALMARTGMNFRDILAALTTTPAQQFGETERRGRIAARMQADLVFLRGNPADDVAAFASVERTMRAGRLIYPYR